MTIITMWCFLLLLTLPAVNAQPRLEWSARYNGTANGDDYGMAMALDGEGNVYMAGSVLNAGSGRDLAIVKFDTGGRFLWARFYNGDANADDWANALVVGRNGDVCAAGNCQTLTQGSNYAVMCCDSSGIIRWTREYDGGGNGGDAAQDIALDEAGNVYLTGRSTGTAVDADIATLKYAADGRLLWAVRYDGSGGDDAGRSIAVDGSGCVWVTGGSAGNGPGYDALTIRYDPEGRQLWADRYDGPGHGDDLVYYKRCLVVDDDRNAYLVAYSKGADSTFDYLTMKYDSTGRREWTERYSPNTGGADYANAIAVDRHRNVYVTGGCENGTRGYDIVTVRYANDGRLVWQAEEDGTAGDWDEGYAVSVDNRGNVYVAGRSVGASSSEDIVLFTYDSTGARQWSARYDQSKGYDWPFAMAFDGNGAVYVAGYADAFSQSPTGANFIALKYSEAATSLDIPSPTPRGLMVTGFPNPARDVTHLVFRLAVGGEVSVSITAMEGAPIRDFALGYLPSGEYRIPWRTTDVPPGVYFCRIRVGGHEEVTKVCVVR